MQMAEPRSQPSTLPLLLSIYRQRHRPAPPPAHHVPPGIRAPQSRALTPTAAPCTQTAASSQHSAARPSPKERKRKERTEPLALLTSPLLLVLLSCSSVLILTHRRRWAPARSPVEISSRLDGINGDGDPDLFICDKPLHDLKRPLLERNKRRNMGLAAAAGSSRARGGRGGSDAGGQHQAGGSEPVDSSLLQGLLEETGEESSAAIMEEIHSAGTDTDEVDDSPIEEVRLTVPITDDPTLPALTFRTWFLGLISCALLAFCNQFFSYRQNPLYISSLSVQIVVLPLGRLMAACLPTKVVGFKGTRWSFSLNPGPFNLKEHVLITIFANTGSSYVYAVGIVTIVKAFYHRDINPLAAMLLTQTTQLMGYGWAGLFRKYLVDSPYMWWPCNLVQVSLFRALHEKEKRPKGGITRLQFFLLVLASSFAYYVVPNFLFPTISTISVVCLVWRNSVTAQQIGSGVYGLGVGSFGLDWATVAGFLGTPLGTPAFAIMNVIAGFFLVVYVLLPVAYWSNAYDARRFPIISSNMFMANGSQYNVSQVLDPATFEFSQAGYDAAGQINLSIFFAFYYGLTFAALAATLSHVALFHGRSIWQQMKATVSGQQKGDVHTRLMKKNYAVVPQWWFHVMLVLVLGLSIFTCEGFRKELQLPYWGVLLAAGLAFLFTLPIGIITATTNQQPVNVVAELIIGYLYPGRPLANVVFKTYGYISMSQAIIFLMDFKLGHYMKIPPRSMFAVQLVGTVLASTVYFSTSWWLLESVSNICDPARLPAGSPWTCPGDDVFYNASIIWGVVGPQRIFGSLGRYTKMNYFFLAGALAPVPVWALSRAFPEKGWIRLVNMPVLLSATGLMPPARSVNYIMWGAVGLTFNHFVYRRYKAWWARHNYVLSAALDAGVAFMGIASFVFLQSRGINGINWWGLQVDDHCDLASCPTAPGVSVPGCPEQ